jgi:hypothetical protein
MELDFSKQIEAARSGPKSSAQTPAKPEERKKGSKMNEPGSAGTKPDAKEIAEKNLKKESKAEITFSDKVTEALKNKVKQHNEKHSKKVSLSQLKKVYRRGLGAFSSTHRPGKSRAQWAMARVNTFLKMMRGEKVKDSYRAADQDVAKASDQELNNLSENCNLDMEYSDIEFALAKIDMLGAGATVDEIYEDNFNEDWELFFSSAEEKKTLNKPFRTPKGPKKFSVYVKNDKGNVVKVNFGDPNMDIKRDDPERRKSFRARHQCDTNPGPKWKARYWSCRMWEAGKSVTDYTKGDNDEDDYMEDENDLLEMNPDLKEVCEETEDLD